MHTFVVVLVVVAILAMGLLRGLFMRKASRTSAFQDPNRRTPLHRFQMHLRHGWWLIFLAGLGLTIYNVVEHNPYRIGGPGTLYLGVGIMIAGIGGGLCLLRMRSAHRLSTADANLGAPAGSMSRDR